MSRSEKKKTVYNIIEVNEVQERPIERWLWNTVLSVCMAAGVALALVSLADMQGLACVIPPAVGAGTVFLVMLLKLVPQMKERSWLFPAVAAAVVAVVGGVRRFAGGLLGFVNCLIAWRNIRYEDAAALLENEWITSFGILIFILVVTLVLAGLIPLWICRKNLWAQMILMLVFSVPGLMLGGFSPVGSACMVTACVGGWLFAMHGKSMRRLTIWLVALAAVFFGFAFFIGSQPVQAVKNFRESVKEAVHTMRYGSDTLPEGNLYEADSLKDGDDETLVVTETKVKTLYLKGFVGTDYEDGQWQEITAASFGGENAGMMDWLSGQDFIPASQAGLYYELTDSETIRENEVTVENVGANREYAYLPATAENPGVRGLQANKDAEYVGKGLRGSTKSAFSEWSMILPTELLNALKWTEDPQTDSQQTYLSAEAVYRTFVYANYLTLDEDMQTLVDAAFWDGADTEDKEGLYNVTQRIREVLSERMAYTDDPEAVPEDADPITWFLTEANEGNAAYFASAAVMAYRAAGIPARYAEGYLLQSEKIAAAEDYTVTLTDQDAHAWVEVYVDGVGWMPVDVTPGYYYDAAALMQMVSQPQGVVQTAALEESGEDAAQAQGDTGAGASEEEPQGTRPWGRILAGILVLILLLLFAVWIVMEIVRIVRRRSMESDYMRMSDMEKTERTGWWVMHSLAAMGIDAQPGWKNEETDAALREKIPEMQEGDYIRASEIIEKSVFGGMELKAYERRALDNFCEMLLQSRKRLGWRERMHLRYHH